MRTPKELLAVGYDAFNRRDVALLRELIVDDFIWNEAAGVPGRRSCASAEEFLAYIEGFDLLWRSFEFEPLELRACAGGAILAKVRGVGHGRASDQPAELLIHHVWRFRDGRVAGMDAFLDESEAAAAAGLPA